MNALRRLRLRREHAAVKASNDALFWGLHDALPPSQWKSRLRTAHYQFKRRHGGAYEREFQLRLRIRDLEGRVA